MLTVLISSIVFMLIAFAMFSIRILVKRNAEFRGTCANNNPFMQKEGVACGVCGRKPDEPCGSPESNRSESKQLD
jgi:hypothetical protein